MREVLRQAQSSPDGRDATCVEIFPNLELHAEGVSDEVWRELVGEEQPLPADRWESMTTAERLERELSKGLRDEHDFNSIASNFISMDELTPAFPLVPTVPPSFRSLAVDPFGPQPTTCAWDGGCSEESAWDLLQQHMERQTS